MMGAANSDDVVGLSGWEFLNPTQIVIRTPQGWSKCSLYENWPSDFGHGDQ